MTLGNRDGIRAACEGWIPLDAKLAPWMVDALQNKSLIQGVGEFGSPLHVIYPELMDENVQALQQCAADRDLDFRIFFARKSNKCIGFLNRAIELELGIDVASENELQQAISRGANPSSIICTAAIKDQSLLDQCAVRNVTVVIDNFDELDRVASLRSRPPIAIRFSGFRVDAVKLKSRFGFDVDEVDRLIAALERTGMPVQGLHFHLHGASIAERVAALRALLAITGQLRALGHPVTFLDMGGGFPVNYLEHEHQWNRFWQHHRQALLGRGESLTVDNHSLGRRVFADDVVGPPNVYPYWQDPVGDRWLGEILDADIDGTPIHRELRRLNLQLRCEPGRSLLDGCGMTVARVEYRKQMPDGDWLVGLAMNRTQCRTTSDDFLVDPILLPRKKDKGHPQDEIRGYLVGAYCTETDFISLRLLRFPRGVAVGDLIAFPNTAGYLMHMMESPSHQMPLAKNAIWSPDEPSRFRLDLIDRPAGG